MLTDDVEIFLQLSDAIRRLRKISKTLQQKEFGIDADFESLRTRIDHICNQYDSSIVLIKVNCLRTF